MKLLISKLLPVTALWLAAAATPAQAQSSAPIPRYKDMVADNPTAEADIKVVSDYVNALVSGNTDKAKALLAAKFKGYGPAPTDLATVAQTISNWQRTYQMQANRKVEFVTQTFHVKAGALRGNWVSMWGNYSFTEGSKSVKFPFQYTAHVTNGKIDQDRIYYDQLYIVSALGYKVTPPEASK